MNKLICKITIILFLLFSFFNVFSQVEIDSTSNTRIVTDSIKQSQLMIVEMKNGGEHIGYIIKKDADILVLKTVNGALRLIASDVVLIEKYVKGYFDFDIPLSSRYFWGPSGIPLEKGEGNYQNTYISINRVDYGISNNLSISGGVELITLIGGSGLWFVNPKLGFEISENIHLGMGAYVLGVFGEENIETIGYGVLTLGDLETNLSLGGGYSFALGEVSEKPLLMISGTQRISNRVSLISENYIIPDGKNTFYLGIQGIRIFYKKNAFDIGLLFTPELKDILPVFPYFSYTRLF